jgi:hypothetical protein
MAFCGVNQVQFHYSTEMGGNPCRLQQILYQFRSVVQLGTVPPTETSDTESVRSVLVTYALSIRTFYCKSTPHILIDKSCCQASNTQRSGKLDKSTACTHLAITLLTFKCAYKIKVLGIWHDFVDVCEISRGSFQTTSATFTAAPSNSIAFCEVNHMQFDCSTEKETIP